LRHFDLPVLGLAPRTARGGVVVWRALAAGGSTTFALGNAVACLVDELREYGVDISAEISEVEEELAIESLPEENIGPRSRRIRDAAAELGYDMRPMPKMVASSRCTGCGRCVFGCARGARWAALGPLREATEDHASVEYGVRVIEAVVTGDRCTGVRASTRRGIVTFGADCVILAAGGLGTPVILQKSGIAEAGKQLFVDLLQNTYGLLSDRHLPSETPMSLVCWDFHGSDRFTLSPYAPDSRLWLYYDLGLQGLLIPPNRLIGIMTKCADDPTGQVLPNGRVCKRASPSDIERLRKGNQLAVEILEKAGAPRSSMRTSRIQGAHPGGTAAIGVVVDQQLRTRIENLYVCDASVLPLAPGCPPIVTIAALAKRLAKQLARN
jgi:choline dehydrogenase-like flavoprotein